MGRPHRAQYPGASYRIRLVGNNRGRIFKDDGDRERFLSLLDRAARHFSLKIHAFCLGGREAELVLETPLGNLSKAMQAFETAYTKAFNGRHRRLGHVFQGRYHSDLLSHVPLPQELSCALHGPPSGDRLALAPAVGLADRNGDAASASAPGTGAASSVDARAIVEQVSRESGVPLESLLAPSRNRVVSRARREAVYRAYQAGLSISALGRAFRRTPAGIAQMIKKREISAPRAEAAA